MRLDFHTEMEALSRETGRSLEHLRANRGVWRLFILARRAYDMGVESMARKEKQGGLLWQGQK